MMLSFICTSCGIVRLDMPADVGIGDEAIPALLAKRGWHHDPRPRVKEEPFYYCPKCSKRAGLGDDRTPREQLVDVTRSLLGKPPRRRDPR
jgi:hypothetical protein